jgi:K+-sensing histidine kinase KdpD
MDGMARIQVRRSWVIAAAALVPLALCAVLSGFRDTVSSATAALVLVLVVVGAAATGDRVAGLVAALSSGVWFDFFLTEPYNSFTIADPDDIEMTVLLVLIGAGVTEIALWGRRQQQRASQRAGYLDGVLRAAETIALHEESPQKLADHVARQIADVLAVSDCRFVPGRAHETRYAVMDRDGGVTRSGRAVNVERDGLPTDEETVLLVRRGAEVLGHFVVTSATDVVRPTIEQRRVAVLLADQMGAVLGRV